MFDLNLLLVIFETCVIGSVIEISSYDTTCASHTDASHAMHSVHEPFSADHKLYTLSLSLDLCRLLRLTTYPHHLNHDDTLPTPIRLARLNRPKS